MGYNRALIAMGQKILLAIYYMPEKKAFRGQHFSASSTKTSGKQKDNRVKKIKAMGYKVELFAGLI